MAAQPRVMPSVGTPASSDRSVAGPPAVPASLAVAEPRRCAATSAETTVTADTLPARAPGRRRRRSRARARPAGRRRRSRRRTGSAVRAARDRRGVGGRRGGRQGPRRRAGRPWRVKWPSRRRILGRTAGRGAPAGRRRPSAGRRRAPARRSLRRRSRRRRPGRCAMRRVRRGWWFLTSFTERGGRLAVADLLVGVEGRPFRRRRRPIPVAGPVPSRPGTSRRPRRGSGTPGRRRHRR